ncbi:MAG: lysophospholipid acyltransferase family protein [Gemmatimonadetes bacterium]|nr:lysophospholipid acyltransferase family protein [Gemmatimonadota bacterium]
MRRPTWRQRVEYAGFRLASALACALPERAALRFGELLGEAAYRPVRIRRAEVERHLRAAFPERPVAWRRQVARDCYRHLGREGVTVLRLTGIGAEVLARAPIAGFESLERALRAGRGALVVTGHLGNWEIGAAALAAHGVPLDVVARRQANPLFDRALRQARERVGVRVIDQREAPREVLRSLRSGRAVALLGDQDARRAGIFVDFLGMLASTARGPALFALRTGAPIFVGLAVRAAGPGLRYDFRLMEIVAQRTGVLAEDVRRLTAEHVRALERVVREVPGQYFWQHRRWKTRPAQEPRSGRQV